MVSMAGLRVARVNAAGGSPCPHIVLTRATPRQLRSVSVSGSLGLWVSGILHRLGLWATGGKPQSADLRKPVRGEPSGSRGMARLAPESKKDHGTKHDGPRPAATHVLLGAMGSLGACATCTPRHSGNPWRRCLALQASGLKAGQAVGETGLAHGALGRGKGIGSGNKSLPCMAKRGGKPQ